MERTELWENHVAGYCQIVAQAPHVHRLRNRPGRCLEDMTSVTRSQAAKESACSFDKLDKMNATTAKFTSWIVMIRNPKILTIRFWSKHQHKFVDVKRFQCVLASADPKQYMYGCVLQDYRSENAIDEALAKFEEGSVWKISRPVFDTKSKREYVSCPIKMVVVMKSPTEMEKLTDPGDSEDIKKWWPSGDVHVPMSLSNTINALKQVRIHVQLGNAKTPSKALDVCGKIIQLEDLKTVKKKDGSGDLEVADLTIVDDSGVSFKVAIWGQETYDQLSAVTIGSGISLIGCNATKDSATGEFKISVWPSAHVVPGGERADALSQLSKEDVQGCQTVTAAFSATATPIDIKGQQAVPSTCTALASIPEQHDNAFPDEVVFQLNRVTLSAPTDKDALTTKNGDRLWVQVQASDWTGSVTMNVSHEAVPALYGCTTAEEVLERATASTLQAVTYRVNMRGVVRFQDGQLRKIISEVMKSPLETKISRMSMLLTKGIAGIGSDIAMAAPVNRIQSDALQGMCVVADKGNGVTEVQACLRLYLLVTGTSKTTCATQKPGAEMEDQEFRVCSPQAKCQLSSEDMLVDLVGYCNFHQMPEFCLHTTSAVVAISNFTKHPDGRLEATMEGMEPVNAADLKTIKASFDLEWQTALTSAVSEPLETCWSPAKCDFWKADNCRAVSNIEEDPETPLRKKHRGHGGD